jgi:hypothetical protein
MKKEKKLKKFFVKLSEIGDKINIFNFEWLAEILLILGAIAIGTHIRESLSLEFGIIAIIFYVILKRIIKTPNIFYNIFLVAYLTKEKCLYSK